MAEKSFPFSTREKFYLWYSKITRSNSLFLLFFSILIGFYFLLVYFMAIDNILGWTLLQVLAMNSALLEKYSRKHSQADRLKWQRTAFHSFPFSTRKKFHLWYSKITRSNSLFFVFFFSINWFFLLVHFMAIDNILGWTLLQILMVWSTTVLPNGEIFAMYMGNTNNFSQFQCKAVPVNISDPLLIDWVKYEGNPILYTPPGIGFNDHQDPSTVWKGPDGQHRMIMGSKQNKTKQDLYLFTIPMISRITSCWMSHCIRSPIPIRGNVSTFIWCH
ncbi:putative 2,1-fructan:2,1-fructan 1-fructosyltransferase [Helianthus anomalus]